MIDHAQNLQRAAQLIDDEVKGALKPKTQQNVWQWAEEHVHLDRRFTSTPGPYRSDYMMFSRGPQEWFCDPRVRKITLAKSAQIGGSTILANCIMFAVCEDPGPILYVTSTGDNGKSWNEREFTPRVQLCDKMAEFIPDEQDAMKKMEMHFKSCTFRITGSNSAANLASRPIRYAFNDEVDKWPDQNQKEAGSLDLVEVRVISYEHTSKIFNISTPTVETGAIWQDYLKGDQRKFHVPCPHCGHRQELIFERVKWPEDCQDQETGVWDKERVERETWYECENERCGHRRIDQESQREMVRKGVWVATNPDAPAEHISAHISALYSPKFTWGKLAKLFLTKKGTPGGLHDFYNSYLGLPWQNRAASVTRTSIELVQDNSPEYRLLGFDRETGDPLPIQMKPPEMVILTADVQQSSFWWVLRGYYRNEASFLIDYGNCVAYEDLMGLVDRPIPFQDPAPPANDLGIRPATFITPYKGLIDIGYKAKRTAGVYDFILQSAGRFVGAQGRSTAHGMFQPVRETEMEHKGMSVPLLQFNDTMFKEELYLRKIKERSGAPWWLPLKLSRDYLEQLTAEKLVQKPATRGGLELVWEEVGDNHLGDCEKMQLAAFAAVAFHFREMQEEQAAA